MHNNQPNLTIQSWNAVADAYADKFMNLDIYNHTYDGFCDKLGDDRVSILEIGCGPGNITRYLINKLPNCSIDAVDAAENMVQLARKNCPEANVTTLDCRHIDTFTKTYDGVVCGFCMPYLSFADCTKLMEDVHHLLNPSGLFYLSFILGNYAQSGLVSGSNPNLSMHQYFYSQQEVVQMLERGGFHCLEIWLIDYNTASQPQQHGVIIARRAA